MFTCLAIGTAVLALLLAGYLAQKYLPPPPPKIVGIDLGKLPRMFTSTFENKISGVNREFTWLQSRAPRRKLTIYQINIEKIHCIHYMDMFRFTSIPSLSGTTYSCIGVYHAVTGNVDVLEDAEGHKCIPSIVAFR